MPRTPAADVRPPVDAGASRSLAALVTREIVPRLMVAHGRSLGQPTGSAALPDGIDLATFAPLTLEADTRDLLVLVDRLLAGGATADTLMVDLLAPTARLLGTWWEEDRCDFVEVTMGLWRLQQLVRELAQRGTVAPTARRRALFAAFPGDQHDFGAVIVSELFRRNGWDAEQIVAPDMAALLAAVGEESYDLIGLTVSCDCHSARLPSAVLALRSVSRNPRLRVLLGGRVLNADPALCERVGADGTAADAREALLLADELVDAIPLDETCACCC